MMAQLWRVQFRYYWQLVKFRFLLISIGLGIVSWLVGWQLTGSIYPNVVARFFSGPTALDIRSKEIIFPSLWLGYFIFPLIMVGDSFKLLWQRHAVQLFGYRFSKANFAQINLLLVSLIAGVYTLVEIATMALVTLLNGTTQLRISSFNGGSAWLLWGALVYGQVLMLLLIQMLGSLASSALGLIAPTVLLVLTIYWPNQYNPLNQSIFQRVTVLNMTTILITIGLILGLMVSYFYIYRSFDSY